MKIFLRGVENLGRGRMAAKWYRNFTKTMTGLPDVVDKMNVCKDRGQRMFYNVEK